MNNTDNIKKHNKNNNLRDKFGKEWSFPASIHANGNDDGGPAFVASSNIIVMASINMTISGACTGAIF